MPQYEIVHELKIHRQPFEDLLSGVKTCEVRRCDDRNFSVGDLVWLRELRDGFDNPWSGRELRKRITHIQKDYGLPGDLCILSYAPAEDVRAVAPSKQFWREQLRGVEVSIDVSTCDEDAGNRLFGTVSEFMDHAAGKHGFILLVHDQEPNFDVRAAGDEPVRNQCDGCQAGIPLIRGAHRMGKPGGYPDPLSCTADRYRHPHRPVALPKGDGD